MNVSVILGHPNPQSFNHAIASIVVDQLQQQGHRVAFHDLCAEQFDPLMPAAEFLKDAALPDFLAKHCREIAAADGIVIIHPNWWGQPPAILKGWVDRVLRSGVAYDIKEGEGIYGILKAQVAVVLNTSNTPAEFELAQYGDPLENLWKKCIFGLCGVKTFFRENFSVVVVSNLEQRQKWLTRVRDIIREHFPFQEK